MGRIDTRSAMGPARDLDLPPLGVAAKGIIARSDGSVLVIRRSGHSTVDPSTWDLPGGKMDMGETLVETVAREAREETGLEVVATAPFHVEHFRTGPIWVTCVTFLCSPPKGQVSLSDEHGEHAWIAPSEIEGRTYGRGIRAQLEAYFSLDANTLEVLRRRPTRRESP